MFKVLLVDDEVLTRTGLKYSISWNKYNMEIVYEASGVDEAVELLHEHSDIDIIFTDIVMPVKNVL